MPRARLALLLLVCAPAARADERVFAADPAAGLALPMSPLAGDQDGTATVVNPAGLVVLGGPHLEVAATGLWPDGIQAAGSGLGVYAAASVAPPLLPRLGFGIAGEKLLPPRGASDPDPGRPFRLTLAAGVDVAGLAVGASWHHFFDSTGAATAGLDTVDLGIAGRLGAYLAFGLVAHDLAPPIVAEIPLERRWDLELVGRPLGTDRLELAAGLVIGERRGSVDPRARAAVRLARGLWARAQIEARTLYELTPPGSDTTFEVRASLGLEVSFGALGAGAYATASSGPQRTGLSGFTALARWSGESYAPLLAPGERIERLKISGDVSDRELVAMLLRLRRYERDDEVRAVFVQLDGVTAGWGTLEELRDAFARLRAHKKKVFTYVVAASTREYYLAAAADRVYIDAGGGVRLVGMASSVMFFKDLFDKIGVAAQFEKIEEYKSAPEAWTRASSSQPAREMHEAVLDDVYRRVVARLAADRGVSEEQMRKLLDDGPYTAGEALAEHIVDAVVEPTELDRLVAGELGGLFPVGEPEPPPRPDSWSLPQVAVIYLDGDIVDGKSFTIPIIGEKVSGSETLSEAISWARENPRVKAVVLRVSSPGGSATASDVIAREGFRLRGTKPFVVSIGDVSASGGYFVSAPADVIFAEPSSITGSIGIFTGKFEMSELAKRVGITWETTKRGPHADMESILRPYSDDERQLIKRKLRYYYLRFVDAVARGRGMKQDEVDAVGRGRVWTGAQAKDKRLVDRFGGVLDALLEAKRRAGFGADEPVELVQLPREPSSLLERLLRFSGAQADAAPLLFPARLLRNVPASLLVDPTAVQARMPFVVLDE